MIGQSQAALATTNTSTSLKDVLAKKIVEHQKTVGAFRKEYGETVIQQLTVDMAYGGMRSVKALVCETSVLDAEEGIRFRNYTIPECQKLLPKAAGGEEPLPEGIWWLLCTGDIPTKEQVAAVSADWAGKADIPDHVAAMLDNFPPHLHPMAQLIAAAAALNTESKFAQGYASGKMKKASYWEYAYEDATALLAKLPTIAAIIYRNLYRDGSNVGVIDPKKDWSANFAAMLGYDDKMFTELLRLYLVIHSDHGRSTLLFISLICRGRQRLGAHVALGRLGAVRPLPGLLGGDGRSGRSAARPGQPGGARLPDAAEEGAAAQVHDRRPGEGRVGQAERGRRRARLRPRRVAQDGPAVGSRSLSYANPLRRYECQRQFALKHLPNDPMFKLVSDLYQVTPGILTKHGKTKNPWPNVDAHSGVLLQVGVSFQCLTHFAAALRYDGDVLLHGAVRRVARHRLHVAADLVARARLRTRATQVALDRRIHEAGQGGREGEGRVNSIR